MIRLLLLLCAGLYLTLMVLGEDHGQKRYGLMLADAQPKPAPKVQPQPAAQDVVFIPAQPAKPPVVAAPTQTVALPEAPTDTAALPKPEISGGLLYRVSGTQVNVRSGPGRDYAVLDSLQKGEQVLVVIEEQPVEGWARVRIEGDGIEGYVATRLLTRVE